MTRVRGFFIVWWRSYRMARLGMPGKYWGQLVTATAVWRINGYGRYFKN